jgi:hypothetical protein
LVSWGLFLRWRLHCRQHQVILVDDLDVEVRVANIWAAASTDVVHSDLSGADGGSEVRKN